jgi:hypothetical protein
MNINYKNYWFRERFKREPKIWTIEMVHDLYLLSKKRFDNRQVDIRKCINDITKEIPKNSKGEHIVYFNNKTDNNKIWSYKITYHSNWKSYGTSLSKLNFDDTFVENLREAKLDFLISNERAFELGERYRSLQKLVSKYHHYLFKLLSEMVEEKLREHYKKSNEVPNYITVINIGSKKYFVKVDEQHRYGYLKFEIENEYKEEDIIIIN